MPVDDTKPKVYLAGPDVFRPDSIAHGQYLKDLCSQHELVGLYPMDNEISGVADIAGAIRDANMAMIRRSDAVIANMTAFRGPGMDGGTAYEMGAAAALGIPVFGYSNDRRSVLERTAEWLTNQGTPMSRSPDGQWRDQQGLAIEDFGHSDNLMMACGLEGLYASAEDAIEAAARHFMVAREPAAVFGAR